MRYISKRKSKVIFFSFLILIFLTLIFIFLNKNNIPEIDMNEVVIKDDTEIINNSPEELVIAVGARISPEITYNYYEELMSLVAAKLGMKAKFVQKRTYAEINDLIKNKSVDLAHVCSGPYTKGYEEFGMELLVVPVINGRKEYNCYIIVGQNSNIDSMEDLRGKKFAFSDPNSNTGYLVPNYILSKMGETAKSFFRETFFTYSHDNSIRSVAENQSDGAAVDGIIWDFFNSLDPIMTSKTKIINKSPPYGIPPFVVHPDLDEKFKIKLKNIFLSLHKDKKAMILLKNIQIDRFEEGNVSMYDSVNEMRAWIEKSK